VLQASAIVPVAVGRKVLAVTNNYNKKGPWFFHRAFFIKLIAETLPLALSAELARCIEGC